MMKTLNDYIQAYKTQLEIGDIQKAFNGIIKYMLGLRTYLGNKYSSDFYIGRFSQCYMEMTFFTFTPLSLKEQKLKIGIGFNHEKMQFGAWLGGQNREIQKKYWEIFKGSDWNKYNIPLKVNDGFSIIETVLLDNPDFSDLELLTEQIENKLMLFVNDIKDVFE